MVTQTERHTGSHQSRNRYRYHLAHCRQHPRERDRMICLGDGHMAYRSDDDAVVVAAKDPHDKGPAVYSSAHD